LPCRIPDFYGEIASLINPDGSNSEEVGTTPDILIKKGESALKVCLEEIKR
jgi:hypothetical protein